MNLFNFIYLLKFILFYIFIFLYFLCYLVIYLCYFLFKNFRFYKYYNININTAFFYYKKKSIYFLFWRYLINYIFVLIYISIKYILKQILIFMKNLFYIDNIYLLWLIYIKTKYYINIYYLYNIYKYLYNIYVYFTYHFFFFINIDEMFIFFNYINKNIFKYIKDPLLNRNINFNWFNFSVFNLYQNFNNKYVLYSILNFNFNSIQIALLKKFIYGHLMYLIHYLRLFFDGEKNRGLRRLLSTIFLSDKIYKLNLLQKLYILLKFLIYIINVIIINLIYNILVFLIYLFYIFFGFLIKFKYILILYILLLFCIKYYWFIYYFFFLLYKHYFLYVPLFEVKESTRFFNFEWIDFRNYFNLIFLHNTLVDLSVLNNIIYNDLLNNLNKTLSLYGFKIEDQFDIGLYSLLNINNKDTNLLNNLLNVYNNSQSYTLLKWYDTLKKLLNNKGAEIFKFNRKNYKSSRYYQKPLEQSLRHNSVKTELSYLGLNREHFFKNNYKKKFVLWKVFYKNYFKKVTRNSFTISVSNIKKIKRVPLKYIYLYNSDRYYLFQRKYIRFATDTNSYFLFSKSIRKYALYFLRLFKKFHESQNYSFYFGRIYNFEDYKNKFQMKYKIPSFEWTAIRWRKKIPNHSYFNVMHVLQLEENQKWYSYYDLANKKIKKKRIYRAFYLNYKYPFNLNKNIMESLSYLNQLQLPNYIKIIKKYYYIKNTKIYFMKRYYKKLLHTNKFFFRLFALKFNNWNLPFSKKQLYSNKNIETENINFWSFFDYFKVDKYYYTKYQDIYKEEADLNLYFIKKTRKDYFKLRNNLLRMYSLYFQYYFLERSYFKHHIPIPFNKKMAYIRNKRIVLNYESFKLNWIFKLYLTRDRANFKKFKNLLVLSRLFKQFFFNYFIYCDYTINSYNELYYIKIKSYRLRVLNKINNLKRFFYYKNKYITGWSFFKYLNSFSIQYHIKHFLWNSPYSFILFNQDSLYANNDIKTYLINYHKQMNINMFYILKYKNKIKYIQLHNYSMVFNLFFNVIELNNNWYDLYLLKNVYFNDYIHLYLISFFYYFNCGYSTFKTYYLVDIYRFTMNFLFEYYMNFLIKITRYRYILDYKNYTIYDFLKNYFNYNTNKYIYIKLRLWVKELKFIKRLYQYILIDKNYYSHNGYKKQLIPFWFIFDYYIKLFIYFLLNKYYIKEFFIYYFLFKFKSFLISYSNIVYLLIFYYNFKLWLVKLLNLYFNFNINKIYLFNVYINTNNFILKYIYNYFILFFWYFSIIFQCNFQYLYYMDFIKIQYIFKWVILFIESNSYKINFNNFILIKFYFEKFILYYIKILFNIKNNLIIFKPNYFYYMKQKSFREVNLNKLHNVIFKNTITYRNINSFRHLTINILFFKNIYLSNTTNYIYMLNSVNVNYANFTNLFFYIFKYNYMYLNIIIYLLLYWFIFFIISIFYKKFYNIFFFTYFENSNYVNNWNKLFNDKVFLLSQNYKKNKIYYKIKKKYMKIENYYNIFFFSTFLNKLSFLNNIKYKIMYIKNKELTQKFWNNNNIIIKPNNTKLLTWPSLLIDKYLYNLFIKTCKMPIKLKKENKNYTFYFYDFLNNNLFNFCFFYWVLLVPYFFFEFILIKYHLKGHILIKRKVFFLFKILLDNFSWFIKLYKFIGDGVLLIYKHRYPKTYKGVTVIRNRKKLKFGYFLKWDRMDKQRIRISSLGSYYYWFFRINKVDYLLNSSNYYFNFSFTSNYYSFISLFFIIYILFIKKYINKNFNNIFIHFNLKKK